MSRLLGRSSQVPSRVLDLVLDSIECVTGGVFPQASVTRDLQEILEADFVGAGYVDLVGRASRRWADWPEPVGATAERFHEFAIRHPLARVYRTGGSPTSLRLSDILPGREARSVAAMFGLSHLMTIPMRVNERGLTVIALMRDASDFTESELLLARELQQVLGALYTLTGEQDRPGLGSASGSELPLTPRELSVLDLMSEGLIAAAIAHRLGISASTVKTHIEHIYTKLDVHDRASAALRGQARGR